ncbi:MAG: DoxX family membrane protein, partial [Actinobacteria bacterium]|nr:DoxX family membrane protein [Actinomycetota bacterium]
MPGAGPGATPAVAAEGFRRRPRVGRSTLQPARGEDAVNTGRLLLRTIIGGLFIGHGTQKLFGWFGGPGPSGTEQMMSKLEMRPPRHHALAAGTAEAAGGALLAAGLATPLAAADLIGVMITAIRKVHLSKGPWVSGGGYEYNLVLIAALLVLADDGPGALSADRALGIEAKGPWWALAALGAGAAATVITVELGRRNATAVLGGDGGSR